MTFLDLVQGDAVFIDANTFVYHFAPDPKLAGPCGRLLQRIENQELTGFTSAAILSEVAHRLMTTEARARHGWTSGKLLQRLKQNPNVVQSLTGFRAAVAGIVHSKIQILPVDGALVLKAADLSQQTGLLSNDALLVALMQQQGLTKLASEDHDYDGVPGLTRYAAA